MENKTINETPQLTETTNTSEDNKSTIDRPSSKPKNNSKKFNGFLRNNNPKKEIKHPIESIQPKKSTLKPKKERENEDLMIKIFETPQSKEEYDVFNFLRIKSGYNEQKFWEDLDIILKNKNFSDIKKSNLSLVAYAVLYDSTIVFDKLLEKFGNQLNKEEFDNHILKFGIHKNPALINSSLKFYEQHFLVEDSFLKKLVKDIAQASYRKETNHLFLNWLAPKLNNDLLEIFWTQAISHRNIPIIIESLHHNEYSTYLNQHIKTYEKPLESIGRFFEVKRLLNEIKPVKKIENIKDSTIIKDNSLIKEQNIEPQIWLSDKKEQFKVMGEILIDKKPTEVIVKRKRKIV